VSVDAVSTDASSAGAITHGTYIAGVIAGQTPFQSANSAEASYWQGIAPNSKLFVVKVGTNAGPYLRFPATLQTGFMKWVNSS